MKRFLFLLLFLVVFGDLSYRLLFRPQQDRELLNATGQEAVRVLHQPGLTAGAKGLLADAQSIRTASVDLLANLKKNTVARVSARRHHIDSLELVPAESMAVLDWHNATGTSQAFLSSRFGRSLSNIPWKTILDQLNLAPSFREQLEEKSTRSLGLFANPMVQELFSQRIVFALLPVPADRFKENPQQALLENLVFLVRLPQDDAPSPIGSLLEQILKLKEQYRYQGQGISVIPAVPGKDLYLSRVGSHLIASLAPAPLHSSIDLFLNHLLKPTGFLPSPSFTRIEQRVQGSDFFIHADLMSIKKMISGRWQGMADRLKTSGMSGSERMFLFHKMDQKNNTRRLTAVVQFSPDHLPPFQKKIYTRTPVRNPSLSRMPAHLLVFFWTNWLDLSAWWDKTLAREKASELEVAERISQWIEAHTGMEIEPFLALFGEEFGLNVAEISTAGFFPVPRICLCIEVKDRERVSRLLDKLLMGLPYERQTIAGVSVVSILLANGLMKPSFALTSRFLLVADGRDQIEEIIEVKPEIDLMINDPAYQELGMDLLQEANLVMFVRTNEIIDGLKELASWVGTMVAIQDEEAGKKGKVLIDQAILPLLDGLKLFRSKGVRCYTGPGEVVIEAVVLPVEEDKIHSASLSTVAVQKDTLFFQRPIIFYPLSIIH